MNTPHRPPTEQSDFMRQYSAALTAAETDTYRGAGRTFHLQVERLSTPAGGLESRLLHLVGAEHPNGSVYHPSGGMQMPDWVPNAGGTTVRDSLITYNLQTLHSGQRDVSQTLTIRRLGGYDAANAKLVSAEPAVPDATRFVEPRKGGKWLNGTVGSVCGRYSLFAPTVKDLTAVVADHMEWFAPERSVDASTDGSTLATHSLWRSLQLATEQGGSYEPLAPYVQQLGRLALDNPNHVAARGALGRTLRRVARYGTITVPEARKDDPVPTGATIEEAVVALDGANLLDGAWWVGAAVDDGGVFRSPTFRELVYEKLVGPEGDAVLAGYPQKDILRVVGSYINQLLKRYDTDGLHIAQNARHRRMTNVLREGLLSRNGQPNFPRLIATAETMLEQELGNEYDPAEAMRPNNIRYVGEAVLQLLKLTLPEPGAPVANPLTEEQRLEIEDEHIVHAAIIDALCQQYRRRPAPEVEEPLPSAETVEVMGATPVDTTRRVPVRWTRRHAPARQIRRWGIKDPGGLLS